MKHQPSTVKPELTVHLGLHGRSVVVRIGGELDLATAATLDDAVGQAVSLVEPPNVIIDLGDLTFCDSTGLDAFIRAARSVEALGGRMILTDVPPVCTKILRITGLDRFFTIRAGTAEALDELP
ncbi:STAS domain-containing protein [Actinomadura craniellae]|uniref:STAS domain-containing protein n=1 Tax=Actinomadura craniellae TaxID=2231787 RepID=UPI001314AC6D|nr:STAS domain-containing protein [Actinomadura craniellae]